MEGVNTGGMGDERHRPFIVVYDSCATTVARRSHSQPPFASDPDLDSMKVLKRYVPPRRAVRTEIPVFEITMTLCINPSCLSPDPRHPPVEYSIQA